MLLKSERPTNDVPPLRNPNDMIRNGLAVHSEEQAKKVPKIFLTNEIARNKI
jgi:hypothetical protein